MESWRDTTKGPFELVTVEGGHLFIDDAPGRKDLVQRILGALGAGALGGGSGGGDGVAGELESGAAIVLRLGVGSGEGGAMALTYSLDVREGAFPKEVVSGVAGAFHALLEGGCCDRPTAPMGDLLPSAPLVPPYREDAPVDMRLLHDPLITGAVDHGDAVAVVSGDVALSYAELEEKSR